MNPTKQKINKRLRVGLVVPHIFMHRDILPGVIFSPAQLALSLAEYLPLEGVDVTLLTPGPVDTPVKNLTADLTLFESELAGRGYGYLELLKKHPLTFISLSRQVQAEIIARAFKMANEDLLDLIHIYTNEEDTALPFAALCKKPVVFTHHDPFNFLVKYKSVFPKYKHLNWISLSKSQRKTMPDGTNWVGNVCHGLDPNTYTPAANPTNDYFAYLGRIIEPKGVHLAIKAVLDYNHRHSTNLKLKIAGKHYAGTQKDTYWQQQIKPYLANANIEYTGYISKPSEKRNFLANAKALIVPSTFEEPFGMVLIESLACGTPVIGIGSGAIPEVIVHNKTGLLVQRGEEGDMLSGIREALDKIVSINRTDCRLDFEKRFTVQRMSKAHASIYNRLAA